MIGYILFAVAVVVAIVLAVLLASARRSASSARGKELEAGRRAADAEERAGTRESEIDSLRAAVGTAERRAADADKTAAGAAAAAADAAERRVAAEQRAERSAAAAADGSRLPATLWELAELQQRWARRAEAQLSTAAPHAPVSGLAGGLALEIDRIREETGTPGELSVHLEREPEAAEGLLLLRAVQALLGVVTRRCEAYDVEVRGGAGHFSTVVRCEGFDGSQEAIEDARSVADLLADAGGDASVAADDGDRFEARLVFPVTPHK